MRCPVVRRRAWSAPRLTLLAVPVLLLTAACTGSGDTPEPVPPTPSEVPLAQVDLAGLRPARAPFCDGLDAAAVSEVLGGRPRSTDAYRSGDTRRVAPGVRDVVHEDGCTFTRGSTEAAAWVFAAPATRREARTWVADRAATQGCRATGEVSFGSPGSVLACAGTARGRTVRRISLAGLFGDAWLTCEVTRPRDESTRSTLEAAQRWCAGVVTAAAG